MTKKIERTNRYNKANISDFNNNEIIRYCIDWTKEPQKSLSPMIIGETGVGKTYLFWALYRELIRNGFETEDVKIETDVEMLNEIRSGIATNQSDNILRDYKKIGILLLDDVCAKRETSWTMEQCLLIIDYRWRYNLPTAFNTNYSIERLSEVLGDRIVSRIIGMTKQFIMTGKDRRII